MEELMLIVIILLCLVVISNQSYLAYLTAKPKKTKTKIIKEPLTPTFQEPEETPTIGEVPADIAKIMADDVEKAAAKKAALESAEVQEKIKSQMQKQKNALVNTMAEIMNGEDRNEK